MSYLGEAYTMVFAFFVLGQKPWHVEFSYSWHLPESVFQCFLQTLLLNHPSSTAWVAQRYLLWQWLHQAKVKQLATHQSNSKHNVSSLALLNGAKSRALAVMPTRIWHMLRCYVSPYTAAYLSDRMIFKMLLRRIFCLYRWQSLSYWFPVLCL